MTEKRLNWLVIGLTLFDNRLVSLIQTHAMKVIIVEDNQRNMLTLEELINSFCPDLELVGKVANLEEAQQMIAAQKPDLAFFDIELGGQTAFDLLNHMDTKSFHIIFTTGNENYGANAFKVNAVDYLLKPISPKELIQAVQKVKDLKKLQLSNKESFSKKLKVTTLNGVELIEMSDIEYLVADGKYTEIYMMDGQKVIISKPLRELQEKLDDNVFFRVHRSNVVNVKMVVSYSKGDNCYIKMKSGKVIDVSRSNRNEFIAFLEERLL